MPYRDGDPTHEFTAKVNHHTAKALLIENPLFGEVWLPLSQIVEQTDPDEEGNINFRVTMWWASKAEIV